MSKTELRELESKAVRDEVKILERRMAARESQLEEALDMAHQHEARIAALEDNVDKGAREMDALRASLNSPKPSFPPAPYFSPSLSFFLSVPPSSATSDTLPATQWTPSPPSEHRSRAPSDHQENSDDDSISTAQRTTSPSRESHHHRIRRLRYPAPNLIRRWKMNSLSWVVGVWTKRHPRTSVMVTPLIRMLKARQTMSTRHQNRLSQVLAVRPWLDEGKLYRCRSARQRVPAPCVWDRWEGLQVCSCNQTQLFELC